MSSNVSNGPQIPTSSRDAAKARSVAPQPDVRPSMPATWLARSCVSLLGSTYLACAVWPNVPTSITMYRLVLISPLSDHPCPSPLHPSAWISAHLAIGHLSWPADPPRTAPCPSGCLPRTIPSSRSRTAVSSSSISIAMSDMRAPPHMKSANCRSVRRNHHAPLTKSITDTTTDTASEGRCSGEPCTHQRKPSMTPTIGSRP